MNCKDKSETRRAAILDAALAEFSAKGYAGARVEDIARRAKVAKGTIYLYFEDKAGLFKGLITTVFSQAHAHTSAVLAEEGLSLREKLFQLHQPLLENDCRSKFAQVVRLICSEGLHSPELVASYYRTMVEPLMELHRENLRRPSRKGEASPHAALAAYPQLLIFPLLYGIIWKGMYTPVAELDVEAMYRAYLEMILPDKA